MFLSNLFRFKQEVLVSAGIGAVRFVNWVKHCCASGSCFLAWISMSFRVTCNESYSFFSRIGRIASIYIYYQKFYNCFSFEKQQQQKKSTPALQHVKID